MFCSCFLTENLEIQKLSSLFQYLWQFVYSLCHTSLLFMFIFLSYTGPKYMHWCFSVALLLQIKFTCIVVFMYTQNITCIKSARVLSVLGCCCWFVFSLLHTKMPTETHKICWMLWKLSFQSCVVASVYSVHMQLHNTFFIFCSN